MSKGKGKSNKFDCLQVWLGGDEGVLRSSSLLVRVSVRVRGLTWVLAGRAGWDRELRGWVHDTLFKNPPKSETNIT